MSGTGTTQTAVAGFDDVDEIRARLVAERDEALAIADELAFAVETGEAVDAISVRYRDSRRRMRQLRSLICAEEGIR